AIDPVGPARSPRRSPGLSAVLGTGGAFGSLRIKLQNFSVPPHCLIRDRKSRSHHLLEGHCYAFPRRTSPRRASPRCAFPRCTSSRYVSSRYVSSRYILCGIWFSKLKLQNFENQILHPPLYIIICTRYMPGRYTPKRCTSGRCTPGKCTPGKCTPGKCTPGR